jgi:hypothetical protein
MMIVDPCVPPSLVPAGSVPRIINGPNHEYEDLYITLLSAAPSTRSSSRSAWWTGRGASDSRSFRGD